MENLERPKVVVSECLGFSACRYNGQTIPDKFVEKLKDYVDYETVCPEVEIGLGVPRTPIRLISEKDEIFLYQPASDKDYTKEMRDYTSSCLGALQEVDGFILKGRSPSCGIKDVKVHLGKDKTAGSVKGIGIFASQVMAKYPYLAIEEEGRLTNFRIREHFLTKLYLMYTLRQVEKTKSMAAIVKFQANNKYLLMAYNQKEQKILGRIVANHEDQPFQVLINDYRNHLGAAFGRLPGYCNYINALMHIFGYFSEKLSSGEKEFILGTFEKYKKGNIPLSVPINVLKSHAIEYQQIYLMDQTIWAPFPEELMDIRDTGRMEN
ncbi:MAG: YbgA family protein [Acetobacterium sp.]